MVEDLKYMLVNYFKRYISTFYYIVTNYYTFLIATPIFDAVHKVTSSRVSFTQAKNLASGSKAIIKYNASRLSFMCS